MARVTVEDCLEKLPNQFELVMLAAKRARELAMTSAEARVPVARDKEDKPTVLALREIAAGFFDTEIKKILEDHQQQHSKQHAPRTKKTKQTGTQIITSNE